MYGKALDFAYDAFSVGMGEHIDAISFHEYVIDETVVFRHVKALRGLCNRFNPNIEIIQGESFSIKKRWQRCNEKRRMDTS